MAYPPNWQRGIIQVWIRNLAHHKCEHCGISFHFGTNIAVDAVNRNGTAIIGTVHHINGCTDQNDWQNLVYVCQRCHLHIQANWYPGDVIPANWGTPPRWIVARGLPFQPAIQPKLL